MRRDLAQPDAVRDREAELADHVAGVVGDQRRAEDAVLAGLDHDAQKAFVGAVEHRAVDVVERHGDGLRARGPAACASFSYLPTCAISGLV